MRRLIKALFLVLWIAPATQARAQGVAKPAYVAEAEHNYRRARAEFRAAHIALAQVRRQEARVGRLAMRSRGQWIEPAELWHRKLAAQERLAFAQQNLKQSFAELNDARDAARAARIGPLQLPESLSTPTWWF